MYSLELEEGKQLQRFPEKRTVLRKEVIAWEPKD